MTTIDGADLVAQHGLTHEEIHRRINDRSLGEQFFEVFCSFLHPVDSVYIDPIFGSFHTREGIRAWLVPIMKKVGDVSFDATQPAIFVESPPSGPDSDLGYGPIATSIDEWVLNANLPGGEIVPITKGCSIRKFRDGWVVYAIDYFDTHPMRDPAVQEASRQAGSIVSADDFPTSQT